MPRVVERLGDTDTTTANISRGERVCRSLVLPNFPRASRSLFSIVLLIVGLCATLIAIAPHARATTNLGAAFVLAFPIGEAEYDSMQEDSLILYLLSPTATHATISTAFGDARVVDIPANQLVTVSMRRDLLIYGQSDGTIIRRAVTITSPDPIAVFGGCDPLDESTAFGVPPVGAWGTRYCVPSGHGTSYTAVVAFDSSTVTVTGGAAPMTKRLRAGDVLMLVGTAQSFARTITATRPVGVLQFQVLDATRDEFPLEFLPPVDAFAPEYYHLLSRDAVRDTLEVTALSGSTAVMVNGDTVAVLGPGESRTLDPLGPAVVTGSYPILVRNYQGLFRWGGGFYSVENEDVVNSVSRGQFLNDIYFGTPEASCLLTIVCPEGDTGGIAINDQPLQGARWTSPYGGMRFAEVSLVGQSFHVHSDIPVGVIVRWAGTDMDSVGRLGILQAVAYNPAWSGRQMPVGAWIRTPHLTCATYSDSVVTLVGSSLTLTTISVDSMTISGADSAAFVLTRPAFPVYLRCAGADTSGDTLRVPVRFTPHHLGVSEATLLVYSSDTLASPVTVILRGVKDSVAITVSRKTIDFGARLVCDGDTTITVTVRNVGTLPETIATTFPQSGGGMSIDPPLRSFTIDPGATQSFTVHFWPQSDSVWKTSLVFRTACDSMIVAVRGRCVAPSVVVTGADLGAACVGDSLDAAIVLTNPTVVPITVTSASVIAPFFLPYGSAEIPRTIAPRDTMHLHVRYRPASTGADTANLAIVAEPCDIEAATRVTAASGTPMIRVLDAPCGTVCAGGTGRTRLGVVNAGTVEVRIDSVALALPFSLGTPLPVRIPAGDTAWLDVVFSPPGSGTFASDVTVLVSPCGVTATAHATGRGASAAITANDIHLDTMRLADVSDTSRSVDTTVAIVNAGSDTVTIDTVLASGVGPNPPVLDPEARFTIAPGDTHRLHVHYRPRTAETDTLVVCVVMHDPCYDSLCITVSGAAILAPPPPPPPPPPAAALCPDTVPTKWWGDDADVTMELSGDISGATGVSFNATFSPLQLQLRGITSTVCSVSTQILAPGVVRCTLDPCGMLVPGAVCDLRFAVLASSNDTTISRVTIDSVALLPAGSGGTCDVQFPVIPPCGMRGVLFVGAPAIVSVHPNPVTTEATVAMRVPPGVAATAHLCDMYGRVVRECPVVRTGNGTAIATINIDEPPLASGAYTVVLDANGTRVARSVVVTR